MSNKKNRILAKYCQILFISGLFLMLSFETDGPITRTAAVRPAGAAEQPKIELLWKRTIGIPVSLSGSTDGRFIVTVGEQGVVRCFGEDGKVVWKVEIPSVDRAVVASDGSALLYSFLNPLYTTVYFIAPDGTVLWKHEVEGAVWIAAASTETGQFAVGTGEAYCYIYTVTKDKHRYKRWKIPGAPCSMRFLTADSLLIGTWQESGTGRFQINGKKIAWHNGKGDRLYSVDLSATNSHSLILARPNRRAPEGTVYVQTARLEPVWEKEFPVYNLTADVSPSGEYVAVGYQRMLTRKDEEILENRIALYDKKGKQLWEKGGMFADWDLLQMCSSGRVLVHDSAHIYCLDQYGKVLLRKKLPATVRKFARIHTRDRIAISCGDGQLCVFSIK